jgi:predicted transcriptional regulator of viral defense system
MPWLDLDPIGSAEESCFVIRPLHVAPALALFVVLRQSATTIGLARMMIAKLASRAGSRGDIEREDNG